MTKMNTFQWPLPTFQYFSILYAEKSSSVLAFVLDQQLPLVNLPGSSHHWLPKYIKELHDSIGLSAICMQFTCHPTMSGKNTPCDEHIIMVTNELDSVLVRNQNDLAGSS